MSGVEFNGNVSGIKGRQSLTNIGHIRKAMNLGIMGYGYTGNAGGISAERNILGLQAVTQHFADVPLMVYNNKGQTNLDLTGATLIPDFGAVTAEV